ncbi:MAG: peptide-methionine (R)-S-oxide reductase MsrB [Candidatus Thiodiazotropha lotti]|uniref:peptide-methionine (R)-S-oxide reductase n=1 Tax=Candidatus Thiodiazotropha endoloripes TaxID=1818881 RepID=A0A1E2UHU6_9GAMM|nr:peptide-methionine (R)-S-oxide reductase MsrB [Candidatus Thiodiazotropha endoloripes]MCG7900299.1 peptide-methionine (R)-S-oxide reductase MsrB [Candidatus Thiodiazotropha weberae]MCG7993134.1 peptide-methionine (R)-S-oxide reductase MsrB [Candidatus Thiodiazotropha lotti]MCG7903933.1 peptide-methionine (R)-S-oxide reductase MsrB [Candidatus Thiodiazotropha weberae]MCG7915430.1 peptide-methionine (R)-S-oxide reductase MsrB [Candidatus Thiodiazotropha weberae]MCG8000740.1 peptide-methionine
MKRRSLIKLLGVAAVMPVVGHSVFARQGEEMTQMSKLELSEEEWRKRLTPEQFRILREEGTEMPGSSPLLHEKRTGTFVCAGCDNPLFASSTKYESGTGWPSFYDHLPNALGTKKDFKLIWPRTEYHCARCGGHHGHVFNDGPKPTGLRYCNNGVALKFVPDVA